jgi:hypothetical protein
MTRRVLMRWTLMSASIWLFGTQFGIRVLAQEPTTDWSPPVNISNSPSSSHLPLVAADQAGFVYVIWGEGTNLNTQGWLDTVYYTLIEGGQWSRPVDILAVPNDDVLIPDAFLVDPYGRLVVVWHQERGLNIGIASPADASSAQSWSSVALERNSRITGADLVTDSFGVYHLVYVLEDQYVMYRSSEDAASSWSAAVRVGGTDLSNQATAWPCIAVGENEQIYIAWTRHVESEDWGPEGVWFSGSMDGGDSWEPSRELSDGIGYSQCELLLDTEHILHVFWNGSLLAGGRYHRLSVDQGQTWSAINTVVQPEDIRGITGPGTLMQDSVGTLHVVFAGLGQGKEQVWYSRWSNSTWHEPESISWSLPHSENVSAVLASGHQIHAVWREYQTEDIWYSMLDTGSGAVAAPQALPTPSPADSSLARVPQGTTVSATTMPTEATVQPATIAPPDTPSTDGMPDISPVVAGLVSALVLVILVILVRTTRTRT